MPKITLPPKCETTIEEKLGSLFSKFVDLLGKFTEEIEEKIACGDVTLTRIIRHVQNYTMSEENLQASQNLEDLIKKVDTHYDFLDFELILDMAKQFSSADLLKKLKSHSKSAMKFRESQPVEILAKQLKNIYGPYRNVTSGPVAYIDLNSAWNKVNIRGLYILINCFFPNSDRKSLMKHIKITSASVHIEYYMTESSFQKVIADAEEKISFMHLIGIYRFKVNGHIILPGRHENVKFTFESGLLNAAWIGNNEAVRFLIDLGVNVDCTNEQGSTALMLATDCRHEPIVQTLISGGANVNIQDSYGQTALMLASQNGHFQIAELLLNKQINVNHTANNGSTALMFASENGHFQVVELLLNKQADINCTANNGWTALMLASQNGHFQITKLLLNKQANVNYTGNNGYTALMLASQNGHFQVAELLLNKQANVNYITNNGWTALMLASKNGHFQIVELLLDANASPIVTNSYGTEIEISSLLVAVYNNSPDTVDVLLRKVEFPTDHIMRAFVLACYGGHSTLINTLVHKITDLPQKELLMSCVKGDLAAVISTIVESELNPDTPLVCGLTPLMIATSCGHIELIDALIQAGADVNTCNDYGNNALDIAEGTFNKQQDVIQLLLVNGAVHNGPPHQLQHQSIEVTN